MTSTMVWIWLSGCGVGLIICIWFFVKYIRKTQHKHQEIIQEYEQKIRSLVASQDQRVQAARKDSVAKSRSVLRGKVAEQMAPLLPGFCYAAADARFMGDPIDYLVFDGYSALRDSGDMGKDVTLVLLDIKSGKSRLSASQHAIAKAIEKGRVRFEVVRVQDDGTVTTQQWKSP